MRRLKKLSSIQPVQSSNSYHITSKSPSSSSNSHSSIQSQSQHSQSNTTNSHIQTQPKDSISNQKKLQQGTKRQRKPQASTLKKKKKEEALQKANQILKKMQEQYGEHSSNQDSQADDSDTCADIPNYALIDKKQKAKKGKGIKSKNRFFDFSVQQQSNSRLSAGKSGSHNLDHELEEIEKEYKKIQLEKNAKNQEIIAQRRNKLEQRVGKIRSRLQFKNATEDNRYREHIKKKLDDVKDCEQVDLMIQVPKIFKGSAARHTDGALFLKNLGSQQQNGAIFTQQYQEQSHRNRSNSNKMRQDSQQKHKKIDRNMFYSQFGKDLKQMKAVQYEDKKILFKKSSFDELEAQFEKNEHLFKDNSMRNSYGNSIREQLSQRSQSRRSQQSNKSRSTSNSKKYIMIKDKHDEEKSNSRVIQKRRSTGLQPIQPVKEEKQNSQSRTNQNDKKQQIKAQQKIKQLKPSENQKQVKNEAKKRGTNKKKKPKAKSKNKNKKNKNEKIDKKFIEGLFQDQAEDSDDGYDNGGLSSSEDDNEQVKQLIDDNKVNHIKKNERFARKKYMEQKLAEEEQQLRKIKERILKPRKMKCEEDSQSRKRRNMRINEARKKFEEEDGDTGQEFLIPNLNELKKQIQEGQQKYQQQVNQFQMHLRQLEGQIEVGRQKNKMHIHSKLSNQNKGDKKQIKKPKSWKDIKSVVRVGAHQKRGGFGKSQKMVISSKMGARKSSQGKKKKEINLE